jgi:hypothetical protein
MSRAPKDYYAVLHVQPGAPVEIIRASYRTLMQRLKAHPDLGGESAAAAEINEAYAVLKDTAKRAAYDASRLARSRAGADRRGTYREPEAARTQVGDPQSPPTDGSACAFCGLAQCVTADKTGDALCSRCASPLLVAVVPLVTDGRAQRAVHRVVKDEPLRFFVDWRDRSGRAGVLVDLSLTGLRFAVSEPLRRDQIVRVECALFSAVVRIAHCERAGRKILFQVGAQFVTVLFHRQRGSLVSIPV